MNGVAVARNGTILWENDAVGSRKVFRCLPGFRDTILTPKLTNPKPLELKSHIFCCIFLYRGCPIFAIFPS